MVRRPSNAKHLISIRLAPRQIFALNANDQLSLDGHTSGSQRLCCSRMPAPQPTPTVLGQRLRAARVAKGWTQAQLGELLLGVDDPNTVAPRISRYERGMHKPDLATIEKLAELLDLPAAYFLAASDTMAEAILMLSQLDARKQKEALVLIKRLIDAS
ncbi:MULTISPECIES: helix-turn-helix domain-containing protein [Stenotrophomonas]|uniref:helix-turn-helix domain-containing protein n=2 Tax=Stenotrophomonas maltophilia TaxID=40324 RepID=UPI0028B1B9A2|nr:MULTISPECIES: helix-turn-helix transcriptional regulator [Stenotrophomonas]